MSFHCRLGEGPQASQGGRRRRRHAGPACPAPRFVVLIAVLMSISAATPAGSVSRPSEAALWAGVKAGRYIAMIRHALAPGGGDPAHFRLGDCRTQRNLSGEGRRQARAIGQRMTAHGVTAATVYTSQWCRCRETARLLGVGPVRDLPALNSFFRDMSQRAARTRALRQWLLARRSDRPLVLVTHYVNIQALTGHAPASGEVVVARVGADGRVSVAGTIKTR